MLPVLAVAGVLLVTAQMHRFGGGVRHHGSEEQSEGH